MPKETSSIIESLTPHEYSIQKSLDIIQTDYSSSYYIPVKPKDFDLKPEIDSFKFKCEQKFTFLDKQKFLKKRKKIVHLVKDLVTKHQLSLQTLFLSITYFDLICSKMSSFNELKLISTICLILAAKFADDGSKAYQLEKAYRSELTSHYQNDEMFILKLLEYNLNLFTPYDFLSQLLMSGVIFNNETTEEKKINFMYNTVNKIALLFIESNLYIELSQGQIAFGIVAFTRKLLGLEAFCPEMCRRYHIESNKQAYTEGLRIITEIFKVSRSTKDTTTTNTKKSEPKDKKENINSNNSNKQYYQMAAVC